MEDIEKLKADIIISDEAKEQLMKNNSSSRIPIIDNKQKMKEQYEANHEYWKSVGDHIVMNQQQPFIRISEATRTSLSHATVDKDNKTIEIERFPAKYESLTPLIPELFLDIDKTIEELNILVDTAYLENKETTADDDFFLSKVKEYISSMEKTSMNIQEEYDITIDNNESNGYKWNVKTTTKDIAIECRASSKSGVMFDWIVKAKEDKEKKDRSSYYKKVSIAIAGCNSAGAAIVHNQVITVGFNFNDWLDFNRLVVNKSKFLKGILKDGDNNLLYKFNIKVYDTHELNLDKSLSNYSDVFTKWYLLLCGKENSGHFNIEEVSQLATRLFDDEWCKPLY